MSDSEREFEVHDINELPEEELEEGAEEAQGGDEGSESEAGKEEPKGSAGPSRLTYIQELEARLRTSQETLGRYVGAYKELEEDKERFKLRLEREKAKELEILQGRLVTDLLELMDNLDRSVMGAEASRNYDALAQGIKMVQAQFVEKLGKLGVSTIQTVGHEFDPNIHEALDIAATDDESQDNAVLMEFSRGFRLKDRVIRPARVRVGRYSG